MKNKRETFLQAAAVVVMLLFSFVFLMDFSISVKKITESRMQARLSEISTKISDSISVKLQDSIYYIQSVADYFSLDTVSAAQAKQLLSSFANSTDFVYIDVMDKNFNSVLTGKNLLWAAIQYGSDDNLPTASGIEYKYIQNLGIGDAFVVYSPMKSGGETVGIAVGIIKRGDIQSNIDIESFDGTGITYVCTVEGKVLISSENAIYSQLVPPLTKANFKGGETAANIIAKIRNGESGYAAFADTNGDKYSYYNPLGINDWYVVTVANESAISTYADRINEAARHLGFKSFLLFALLIVYVSGKIKRSQQKTEKAYEEIKISHKMFEIAMQSSNDAIFSYNIATKTVSYANRPEYLKIKDSDVLENIPYSHARYFDIRPEHVRQYVQVFEQVISGKPGAQAEIEVKSGGEYRWNRIVLSTVYDSAGNPISAVGYTRNITSEKTTMQQLDIEKKYRQAILSNTIFVYEFNTTHHTIANMRRPEERNPDFYVLDKYIFRPSDTNVVNVENLHKEDLQKVIQFFSSSNLTYAYRKHLSEISIEYRIKDRYDQWIWVDNSVYFIYDDSNEVKGIAYIKNINDNKIDQIALERRVEIDALTGLNNRQFAGEKIDRLLSHQSPNTISGFLIFDIDNFKSINDSYGHQKGDEILVQVASVFKNTFRSTDVTARLGGDEFIGFINDIPRVQVAVSKVEELDAAVRKICISESDKRFASLSIGLCIAKKDGESFEKLYENADKALYIAKQKGKGRYEIFKG